MRGVAYGPVCSSQQMALYRQDVPLTTLSSEHGVSREVSVARGFPTRRGPRGTDAAELETATIHGIDTMAREEIVVHPVRLDHSAPSR